MSTDKQLLDWFEFVATKFQNSRDGWIYTRDLGDLVHIRHRHDFTGRNHWTKRALRALDLKSGLGLDGFSKSLGIRKVRSPRRMWWRLVAHTVVALRKDSNRPDGRISNAGILTHWEEDGEYIVLMGPTVGVKVLDFLKAEPDSPHAKAILAEMHRVRELSWPTEDDS